MEGDVGDSLAPGTGRDDADDAEVHRREVQAGHGAEEQRGQADTAEQGPKALGRGARDPLREAREVAGAYDDTNLREREREELERGGLVGHCEEG